MTDDRLLPPTKDIEDLILQYLSDKKVRGLSEIVAEVADYYSLTEEQLNETTKSGQKRFYVHCSWAVQNLKLAGLVNSPERGYWKISNSEY